MHIIALTSTVETPQPAPPRSLTNQLTASLGVVAGPAIAVWAYTGVTLGPGVALLAMESQGGWVLALSLVAWILNQVRDRYAAYTKQQAVIDDQARQISSLAREVIGLKDDVAVLQEQVAIDKETQIALRLENNDLALRLGQYERTPDPDGSDDRG
jgi:hypothetical protein